MSTSPNHIGLLEQPTIPNLPNPSHPNLDMISIQYEPTSPNLPPTFSPSLSTCLRLNSISDLPSMQPNVALIGTVKRLRTFTDRPGKRICMHILNTEILMKVLINNLDQFFAKLHLQNCSQSFFRENTIVEEVEITTQEASEQRITVIHKRFIHIKREARMKF